MSPDGLAAVRLDRLLVEALRRPALLGRLSGVGGQAVQLRRLPPRRPLRQLARQRQGALEDARRSSDGFTYVTYTVRLSPQTEQRHVRHDEPSDRRASKSTGFVAPEQRRVGQGRVLRPEARRDRLLLGVPDRSVQPAERLGAESRQRATSTNAADQPLSTYNPNDPNSSVDTPGSPAGDGADLVPVAGRVRPATRSCPPTSRRARPPEELHGQREHRRPDEDALAVGHLRPGRQRRRDPRHARAATAGLQLPAATGATTTAASPTRRPTRWRSPPSATSPATRSSNGIYPWLGFRIGVIGNPG